ncbi:hypothetical protein GLAREA_08329 [Glarea lozoyensis ATCC 20868]|uniref:Uncharacterized protein n=1 Tax=Glarea lozoyensis (strain ATCC 20868 / MF5171) TaxID=1116229 RepID=S3CD59_GLAL2|nr:uncharacterized protein GLAREA_08329 [Glarea lozoyensis ATCC 20868]EPE24477.1 hypothetical protein GLAREA_08329 [Glarea lozoyensis ATCC 20868]
MSTTTLLLLPREIRDEIYRMVLLPTSVPYLIEPYATEHQPPLKRKAKHKAQRLRYASSVPFKLCLDPTHISPSCCEYHEFAYRNFYHTTLSLLRVNKQIYREARDLFWHSVTFYFPMFTLFDRLAENHAVKVLKAMGQIPSRLVRRMRIKMNSLEWGTSALPKLLQLLASRARYGDFRSLELCWDQWGFFQLVTVNSGNGFENLIDLYDALLDGLRKGSIGCGYERVIRLPADSTKEDATRWKLDPTKTRDTLRVLHFACGGSLYWANKLVWQNYQQVADIDLVEP